MDDKYRQFYSSVLREKDAVYPFDNDMSFPIREIPVDNIDEYVSEEEQTMYPEFNFRELTDVKDTSYLVHSFQKHPATFIPQIPRFVIQNFADEGDSVLDCFSGSGTTGIEALLNGSNYLGVEINPFSKLMSDVVTSPIPPSVLDKLEETVQNSDFSESSDIGDFPGRTNKSHWFEDDAVDELNRIRGFIDSGSFKECTVPSNISQNDRNIIKNSEKFDVENLETRVKKFLVLCLTSTVFEVSNADKGISKPWKSQKMKDAIESGEHPPSPINTFKEEVNNNLEDMKNYWEEIVSERNYIPWSDVRLSDSRNFTFEKYLDEVDVSVTSPPYINAMNYYRSSKLRIFWILDFLSEFETDISPSDLRKMIIGSNSSVSRSEVDEDPPSVFEKWQGTKHEYKQTRLPYLDRTIENIFNSGQSTSEKKAQLTWKFFGEDMPDSIENIYRHLRDNGKLFFVVGENVVGTQPVHTHKYIEDIGENLGKFDNTLNQNTKFNHVVSGFDRISHRELFQSRNHDGGVIECEWAVVFEK